MISISIKQLIVGTLGNIATSIWFIPFFSNFIHKLRGVKFRNFLNVFIGRDVIIDNRYPNLINIESGVVIAPRVMIISHSCVPKNNIVIGKEEIKKPVHIGKNVFIGANSIILPGSYISEGCYVAAGSVVSGRFKKNSLIAGNPANVKRNI